MDFASALVAVISIAAFTIPFIYLSRIQSGKKKQVLNLINSKAAENKIKLDEMDYWNQKYAIGIDFASNQVFYMKKTNEEWHTHLINLADYQNCAIYDANKKGRTPLSNAYGVTNLQLALHPKVTASKDQTLEFFDRSESLSLNGEWILIDKWKQLITKQLSN